MGSAARVLTPIGKAGVMSLKVGKAGVMSLGVPSVISWTQIDAVRHPIATIPCCRITDAMMVDDFVANERRQKSLLSQW